MPLLECITTPNMQRDAMLVMRLPQAVKAALTNAAEKNLRTVSSMGLWAIAEWLKDNGYPIDEPPASVPASKSKTSAKRRRKNVRGAR